MTIQQFIERAIGGGWKSEEKHIALGCYETFIQNNPHWKWKENEKPYLIKRAYLGDILLDPLAWQAVGKVEGWYKGIAPEHEYLYWGAHMHRMIDALTEGKTIEQFLTTL